MRFVVVRPPFYYFIIISVFTTQFYTNPHTKKHNKNAQNLQEPFLNNFLITDSMTLILNYILIHDSMSHMLLTTIIKHTHCM